MELAWLPFWLVRDRIRAGALVPLLPDQPEFLYDGHALWLPTPHLPLKIRVAVDALAVALPASCDPLTQAAAPMPARPRHPRRAPLGAMPMMRLKARLKEASDS
jgi:hypothetical protein